MSTPGPDLNSDDSQEAPNIEHNGADKPSPAPASTAQTEKSEMPKQGAGAKLKAGWASLDIDIPTFLMMLK
jgi:hypothetical protein